MTFLRKNGQRFLYHTYALYVTDVMFQQANWLCGNMMEVRPYFSGKHKLHEYKTESLVLPNGACIFLSKHAKGGEAYIKIFLRSLKHHKTLTKNVNEELVYRDVESKPPNHWAILTDIGYQGLRHEIWTLIPETSSRNGSLSHIGKRSNRHIRKDRLIV